MYSVWKHTHCSLRLQRAISLRSAAGTVLPGVQALSCHPKQKHGARVDVSTKRVTPGQCHAVASLLRRVRGMLQEVGTDHVPQDAARAPLHISTQVSVSPMQTTVVTPQVGRASSHAYSCSPASSAERCFADEGKLRILSYSNAKLVLTLVGDSHCGSNPHCSGSQWRRRPLGWETHVICNVGDRRSSASHCTGAHICVPSTTVLQQP